MNPDEAVSKAGSVILQRMADWQACKLRVGDVSTGSRRGVGSAVPTTGWDEILVLLLSTGKVGLGWWICRDRKQRGYGKARPGGGWA